MEENNLVFYLKRWFLNKYTLLTLLIAVTAVLFVFNQKKLLSMIDLQDEADLAYELALAEQQAELAALGLEKDPAQLSYVEIMQNKDYDFSNQESLKNQDSDNDGLSDYQEIYIYQTSAFLEDTDGDQISDSKEVKDGTDPLCAEGESCGIDNTEKDLAQKAALIESSYVAEDSSGLNELMSDLSSIDISTMDPDDLRAALLANGVDASEIEGLTDEEIVTLYEMALDDYQTGLTSSNTEADIDWDSIDLTTIPQEELRAALLESGLSQSEIDELSDAEVLELYELAIEEYKTEIEAEQSNSNNKTVIVDESNLENLTAEEIRYLLIQEGADEETLSEFTDEEIMALFQEAMAESNQQ